MLSEEVVRTMFKPLETGDVPTFFDCFSDNVTVVMSGKHNPIYGRYESKSELMALFEQVNAKMAAPFLHKVDSVFIAEPWFVVEIAQNSETKGGKEYHMELCLICRYENGKIVEIRYYVDSHLLQKVLDE